MQVQVVSGALSVRSAAQSSARGSCKVRAAIGGEDAVWTLACPNQSGWATRPKATHHLKKGMP